MTGGPDLARSKDYAHAYHLLRIRSPSMPFETRFTNEPETAAAELVWVDRIRAGDVDAFEALYRTYWQRLYAFAFRYVRSKEDAEEVVQDVFFRIWRGPELCLRRRPQRRTRPTGARRRGPPLGGACRSGGDGGGDPVRAGGRGARRRGPTSPRRAAAQTIRGVQAAADR